MNKRWIGMGLAWLVFISLTAIGIVHVDHQPTDCSVLQTAPFADLNLTKSPDHYVRYFPVK